MPSTPNTKSRSKRWAERFPLWLILSIVVHGAFLVWVTTWTVRTIVKRRTETETRLVIRVEDAEKLKANLEKNNLDPLREKVDTLTEIRDRVMEERNLRLEQMREFAVQRRQELPQALEETLSGIVESEQRALAQATKANEELQKTEALRAELQAATQKDALGEAAQKAAALNGQLSAVAGIQQSALDEQNRTLGLIRDAAAMVEWAGGVQGTSLWAKAGEAQAAAMQAMEKAEESRAPHQQQVGQDAKTLAEAARAAEQATARLSQAQARQKQAVAAAQSVALNTGHAFSNAQVRAADAAQKAADSRREAVQAASRAEGAAQAYTAASNRASGGTPEDERIAEQLKQVAANAVAEAVARQKTAEEAGKTAAEAAVVADKTASTMAEQQTAAREAARPLEFTAQEQASLAAARATASRLALVPARVQDTQAAVQKQQAALSTLNSSVATLRSAIAGKRLADYYDHLSAQALANRFSPELDRMNAAEVYKAARRLEGEIGEMYREARAAELAMLQSVPFSVALANTQLPVSTRVEVDEPSLVTDVKSASQLKKYEGAFQAATREVSAMVASAASMRRNLDASTFSDSPEGLRVDVTNILAQSSNLRELTGLASEITGPVQDLSAAMRSMEAKREAGIGEGGRKKGEASGGAASGGSGGSGGSGPPGAPGGGNFFSASGREVGSQGQPAKWFYVGSWYVIGPFPNEDRKNIETVFPPESVIDLNAVYTGAGGKPVGWQYLNAPSCQIEPPDMAPYAIYYAWTEIKMDRDRDLWIATGSDDRSDLWVNDMPVWRSGNWLKNWNMNEAFRKVHFKQGRNKILVRLENGWGSCCFSVLVNLEGE